MKKSLLFFIALTVFHSLLFSQVSSSINVSGDTKIEPDRTNYITATVKNTERIDLIDPKGEYQVWMIYKGSGNEGLVLNKQVKLGDPLGAGKSRAYKISFDAPQLPGDYPVEIVFKRGNKVVSNVEKITFVVAANYTVSITARTTSFYIQRGGTRDIDIRFYIKNTGVTAWPEGKYSLEFEVKSSPSGASKYDKEAFNISPKAVEFWDLVPGVEEEYVYEDFKPPFTDGSYVVAVTLLLDGKKFEAAGNPANINFKMNVK